MDQETPRDFSTPGTFGTSSGSDAGTSSMSSPTSRAGVCAHCGASQNSGLEQFLGKLGISEDMIDNLKSSVQNIDVEEYLNTARDYLKNGSTKATSYAKENPGKVAAGVAVLAVGAGLLISALNKD